MNNHCWLKCMRPTTVCVCVCGVLALFIYYFDMNAILLLYFLVKLCTTNNVNIIYLALVRVLYAARSSMPQDACSSRSLGKQQNPLHYALLKRKMNNYFIF